MEGEICRVSTVLYLGHETTTETRCAFGNPIGIDDGELGG